MKKSRWRADYQDSEGARGWSEVGGLVSGAGDQRGDVLWLEAEVRWAGGKRGAATHKELTEQGRFVSFVDV
jgi:hypothetical protein